MSVRFNTDKSHADAIRAAVDANDGYCPCKLDKTEDTKCMCKEFKDFVHSGGVGLCHCGLFESIESK